MAMNGTSSVKVQRNLHGFTAVLTSAACEWFLIFLLLIDAVFSYLLTKFARYCELQIPCILCSRLDHVLGKENSDSYQNLLCSIHRSEISSLLSCQIHGKLADGRGMCDDCLLSFTTKNKPNPDMHRVFLGKMGFDLGGCGPRGLQRQLLNRDFTPASTSTRLCSCCNMPWRSRQNVQRLLQLRVPGYEVSKPNIPLPRRISRRDSLKKMKDKFSSNSHCVGKSGCDPMSHVGYTELKITSDSESEFPFSDDNNSNSVVRAKNEPKEESAVHCASRIPSKRLSNDVAAIKMTDNSSNAGPSLMDPCIQPDATEISEVNLAPHVAVGHHLGECNYQQADEKTSPSPLPELISLDDIPPPSSPAEVLVGASPLSQNSSTSMLTELISLVDTCPSFDIMEVPVRASPDKSADDTGPTDIGNVSINKHEEILKLISTTAGAGIRDKVANGPKIIDPSYGNQSDLCTSAVNLKEREVSGFVAEQPSMKEHDEDLKLLLSQNFSTQGIDLLLSTTSSSTQSHGGDHTQITDSSSFSGIPNLQQIDSMERNDSAGLESLDGSTVGEIEGESLVDRLKRQVELDKRWLNALHKELEEERSASAIATNQAMAMITRLQEEKAALHMEALQYLRMMEEQAEYDVDALEKANDLLAEKEKEMQDLEAEIEYYRLKFPDESMAETMPESCSVLKEENVIIEKTGITCIKDDANVPEATKGSNNPIFVNSSLSEFKDEKLYISERLKSLERKLYEYNGTLPDMSDGGDFEEAETGGHNHVDFLDDERSLVNGQMQENGLSMRKDFTLPNGRPPAEEGSSFPNSKDQVVSKEKNHLISNEQKDSTYCRDKKFVALENEILDLNDRLEALETDCDFLERSFNSLENGKEGLLFIQEIAHQLQELRILWISRGCQSAP